MSSRMMVSRAGAALLLGSVFLGCDSTQDVGVGAANGSPGSVGVPTVNLDAAIAGGTGGTTTGLAPTDDANCGTQTSNTAHGVADVLLVFDRSGSMDYSTTADSTCAGGGLGLGRGRGAGPTIGCTTRWSALTTGIAATLNGTVGSIQWGLKLFASPAGGACGVTNGVEVPISASSVPAIEAQIASVTPANNTPTAQSIAAATTYLKTVSDSNPKYILLSTDGEPNCASGGNTTTTNVPATIDAIAAAKSAGFPVYVIGIGPSVGNLDDFAAAGGTGTYFPAGQDCRTGGLVALGQVYDGRPG